MTIEQELNNLQTNLNNSYSACEEKGASLPDSQNFDNLPATISSITTGGDDGGEDLFKTIDENGVLKSTSNQEVVLNGVKTVGDYALYYNWKAGTGAEKLSMPDLEKVNIYGMAYSFSDNTTLKEIEFQKEKQITVDNYGFKNAFYKTPVKSFRIDKLYSVGEYGFSYAFYQCPQLEEFIINPKASQLPANFQKSYNFEYVCNGCSKLKRFLLGNYGTTSLFPSGFRYGLANCPSLKFVRIGQIDKESLANAGLTVQSSSIQYAFQNATGLDVIYIQGTGGFRSCTYMFDGCSNLMHASLPMGYPSSANNAGNYMFRNCPKLKQVDFGGNPVFIGNYYGLFKNAFSGTTSGISLWFADTTFTNPNATQTNAQFYGCSGLEKIYAPLCTEITGSGASYLFSNTGIKELHFGIKNKSTIEASVGYDTLWGRGAGNATVYFDLVNYVYIGGRKYTAVKLLRSPESQSFVEFSIDVNGATYLRDSSNDTEFLFAWKNGNDLVYTITLNPIVDEPVYGSDEEIVGVVSDRLLYYKWQVSGTQNIIYTKRKYYAEVGEDYYVENADGSFSVGGQIAAVE